MRWWHGTIFSMNKGKLLFMKNFQRGAFTILFAAFFAITACNPNGNENSMQPENSSGEGAVDSTKIPHFDTATSALNK
jgi:hypothetical protein